MEMVMEKGMAMEVVMVIGDDDAEGNGDGDGDGIIFVLIRCSCCWRKLFRVITKGRCGSWCDDEHIFGSFIFFSLMVMVMVIFNAEIFSSLFFNL